jgi:alpha-tubulin suppressor-like RCC1 family protein
MPTFYNFRENGVNYSFDDVFVPADIFRPANLWTWGNGSSGQLGNTTTTTTNSTPVTTFSGGTDWKQVSGGSIHTAAIKVDGTLWTWGDGNEGRLGNNQRVDISTPITTFTGGTDWKQVSSGGYHVSAIKTDGTLWTWGGNFDLATGRVDSFRVPVTTFFLETYWADTATTNPEDLYTLSAGTTYISAIKTDGTLWTWGLGTFGRLGNAVTTGSISTPITTSAGGTNWKQVSSGDQHTAAIKTDGTLWTWGRGNYGRLGNNQNFVQISTPSTTFSGGTNWKQVSAGYRHNVAIKTDGTLWTWGNNNNGQLGTGLTTNVSTPVTTSAGGTNWKQVSAGNSHTSAIKTDGTLWTWGNGTSGQLGRLSFGSIKSTPVTTFAGGTNWADTPTTNPEDLYTLSAGETHTAAIKTDGTLWIWGDGGNGRLGNAVTTDVSTPVTTFAGGTNWKQVSAGVTHTAVIKTDGTLWLWGSGGDGNLGHANTNIFENISTPITTFAGGTDWKQVSASSFYTTAIKTDGTLWTWGYGDGGILGNALAGGRVSTPITTFAGGTNWKQVSSAQEHTAAIKTDGTLWVWGNGAVGQLGNAFSPGGFAPISTPVTTFAGGTNWKQVSAAYQHTSAIKTDGTLWTWGWDSFGQLGISYSNGYVFTSTPVTTFAGGTNWKQVSGEYSHTAAVKTDGTLWTWGAGISGRLGNATNTSGSIISTPITTFAGGTNWKQVSAGSDHVVALRDDGVNKELFLFGSHSFGQLGVNIISDNYIPNQTFQQTTDWKQVDSRQNTGVAIKTDGTLWVWGVGSFSQLGINSSGNRFTPVTTFAGGTNWKQAASGSTHTTAIKTDGTLWLWGDGGDGQLGNASTEGNINTPITTFSGGTNWKQVSAGLKYTVALRDDGINPELFTWGYGSSGQLGNADTTTRSTPVTTFSIQIKWADVDSAEDLYSLSAGPKHTSAIKTDGTLWTWGYGPLGQLGNADTNNKSTPVTTFAGGTNWKQISSGREHAAAIKTDGTLWIWGRENFSALGNAVITGNISTPITTFAGGTNWKQVSCGYEHTAAIKSDGTLWTWGTGGSGKLGNGVTTGNISTPITTFAGGTNWKQISCGGYYTTSIKTDGTLWTWGSDGGIGLLGNADTTDRSTPVTTFTGGTNWKQVSAGNFNTTAIKTDGTLWSWGLSYSGGYSDSTSTPITTFAGGNDWKQVSSGRDYAVAIKTDGTLWTWGWGGYGKLGIGDTIRRLTPVTTFAGGIDWKQVSAGGSQTVALGVNNQLYIWGGGDDGELGNATFALTISTPITTFAGGTNWTEIIGLDNLYTLSAGDSQSGAIKTDGTLWTWGGNTDGELGNAATTDVSTPVTTFTGGTNWKQLSFGGHHVAAIKTDGTLWTWGRASNGELGNTALTDRSTPITTFAGGTDWKQVSCGFAFTAAVKIDGTLWTWGSGGNARLGNGVTTGIISTPITTFAGGTNWKQAICSSSTHMMAIKTDGTLWTWGNNTYGQLGNADTTNVSTPVTTFTGGTNWKQTSAGDSFTAATKTDGTLWLWGRNGTVGRLGNSATTASSTPVTTFAGGTNWEQVNCGDEHTAAIKTDGTLWTWGNGYSGRLGNNRLSYVSTPITTFAGGTNWKQVECGEDHTIALNGNELFLFGSSPSGEIGNAQITTSTSIPLQPLPGETTWKQVSSGLRHTAAIKTDGTLWTWGNGTYGRLGIGGEIIDANISRRTTPVTTFVGGTNWKQVSSGNRHTMAIKTDGTLWSWGYNGNAELGNNDLANRSTPVTTFAGGSNWKQVSSGGFNTAAIKTDGTLWTWGDGEYGQLGHAQTIIAPTPVTTFTGGTNWKQVSSIRVNTSAIKTDGTLWTWGFGGQGRLGNANTITTSTPVTTFLGGNRWRQLGYGVSRHTAALLYQYDDPVL